MRREREVAVGRVPLMAAAAGGEAASTGSAPASKSAADPKLWFAGRELMR
jgi:hypothetical protein